MNCCLGRENGVGQQLEHVEGVSLSAGRHQQVTTMGDAIGTDQEAGMEEAEMEGVGFGEYPFLLGPHGRAGFNFVFCCHVCNLWN